MTEEIKITMTESDENFLTQRKISDYAHMMRALDWKKSHGLIRTCKACGTTWNCVDYPSCVVCSGESKSHKTSRGKQV